MPFPSPGQVLPLLLIILSFHAAPAVSDASRDALDIQRFHLYGGPGSAEGTFQTAGGAPDWQGWTSVDNTFKEDHWHVSDFNAANLNDNGPGNLAMWCGDSVSSWVDPPGYGNGWYDILEWTSGPLADPSAGQTVDLDFFFNHETEPGYDFFQVQYQVGGSWTTVYGADGSSGLIGGVFAAPGLQYSLEGASPIVYAGNDYGGTGGNEIVLRFLVVSDGAFSDEDGLWPTYAGAAQVDDITVSYSDGGPQDDFEDFEGPGPYRWYTVQTPFVGDFAKIRPGLTDVDACRENRSPQMTFIDDGSPPNNAPGETTGGSTSPLGQYGVPGGWTINASGGLAGPSYHLSNTVWSPPIPLDLPGSEDDGAHFRYLLEFEVFEHYEYNTPSLSAVVMVSPDNGVHWRRRNPDPITSYSAVGPLYQDRIVDITDGISPSSTHVRVGFKFEIFYFIPQPFDATPAPFLDNVHLYKEPSGPRLKIDAVDMFQDAFPSNGGLDVSTIAARDALDVPTRNYEGNGFGGGAAMVVQARSVTESLISASDLVLEWVLDKNPLFEDAIRTMPAGSTLSAGTGPNGWDQVMGTALASVASIWDETFWFDLPDEDFLYPGDRLRYYVRAQIPGEPVSTLPTDVDGFLSGEGYDPMFTLRALPTVTDVNGTQPSTLLAVYASNGNDAASWRQTLQQIGLRLGEQVDLILSRGNPWIVRSASLSQLVDYSCMLVSAEDWPTTEVYFRLAAWEQEPGERLVAYFGDDVVTAATVSHRTNAMGVSLVASSVSASIGNQTAPPVLPLQPGFSTSFVANATCTVRPFDAILPTGSAVTLHGFDDGAGGTYVSAAASVLHDRFNGHGDRIVDVTFPYGLDAVETQQAKTPGASARAELVAEVLGLMGHVGGPPTPAPLPERAGVYDLAASPNPFNPRTEIRFRLGQAAQTRVRVFDLRGRHVVDLHRGPLAAGAHRLPWEGLDANGAALASGVYFVQVRADDVASTLKVSLLE